MYIRNSYAPGKERRSLKGLDDDIC
jgi:hypothetical protein